MPAIYTKHIRYLLLPLLLLLLLAQITIAQNPQIDSLMAVLNEHKEEDTTRINTLNALSWKLINTGDYTQALQYANDALQIFQNAATLEKLFPKGIAAAYNNIGVMHRTNTDSGVKQNDNMKTTKKTFDAVKFMRLQRDKLSEKLAKMTKEEILEYFKKCATQTTTKPCA